MSDTPEQIVRWAGAILAMCLTLGAVTLLTVCGVLAMRWIREELRKK
jgi:hypothetical protein